MKAFAAIAFILSSCGGPTTNVPARFEGVRTSEAQFPVAPSCFLATLNRSPDDEVVLLAQQSQGAMRISGKPVLLRYLGGNFRTGGIFRGDGLTVDVRGVSAPEARAGGPFDQEVKVRVKLGEQQEEFRALWAC